MDLGKAIELGTSAKFTHLTHVGVSIQYRALSDWEFDEIELKMLEGIGSREFLDFINKLKTISDKSIPIPENIDHVDLERIRKERVYWIALKATCDFCDQLSFDLASLEKIKKIIGIKELVAEVIKASGRSPNSKETVKSFRNHPISEMRTVEEHATSRRVSIDGKDF